MSAGWYGLIGGFLAGGVVCSALVFLWVIGPWIDKVKQEAARLNTMILNMHTIYWLRAEIEIIEQPEQPDPEMRWRYIVWREGISHEEQVPLNLGNARTLESAQQRAQSWIYAQQGHYHGRQLPAAIPL